MGTLHDRVKGVWGHQDVTDLQFSYILIRGNVCHVKKADPIGAFVFVHGGGNAACHYTDSTGGRDRSC